MGYKNKNMKISTYMWVLKNRLQHQATQDTHLCANRPFPVRSLTKEVLKKKYMCDNAIRRLESELSAAARA
jgi:hypothetical protein